MDTLVTANANVNARSMQGQTSLHLVALVDPCSEIVDRVTKLSAGIDKESSHGFTPLELAIQFNHHRVIPALIHAGVHVKLNDVLYAVRLNREGTLKLLLDSRHITTEDYNNIVWDTVLYDATFYALCRTLQVLATHWPCTINVYRVMKTGYSAKQVAIWRRDKNSDWAEHAQSLEDPDPEAWYEAWEAMVATIQARHPEPTESIADETSSIDDYCNGEQSDDGHSDTEYHNGRDSDDNSSSAEDYWEDAVEGLA